VGRGVVASGILGLLLLVFLATVPTSRSGYSSVPLGRVVAIPEVYVGQRILTTGTYCAHVELSYAVDGWLEEGQSRLGVVGSIFDWQPTPGLRIDAWGLLRRGPASREFLLDFFNGRAAGDYRRAPRLTPDLALSRTVWLVGRLRQTGSEPFVRWTLLLEDRTQVDLVGFPPPGQVPISGLFVEIRGRVETGALPPSQAAVRVLHLEPVPGPPPPPFGG
jgi:hypothetical protein